MPKHKKEPMLAKPAVVQPAAKPEAATDHRQGRTRGSGFGLSARSPAAKPRRDVSEAPAPVPAGEMADIEYFRRSRDTAEEGFKRVRGTRPTGRG